MTKQQAIPADFGYGEDEGLLRDMARKMLDERLPTERLRNLVASAPEPVYDDGQRALWDEQLWSEIVDLGWTGLAIPESEGGSDFSLVGIAALIEEVGRSALPSPLIPTLAASMVLREVNGGKANALMQRIAAGATASLALTNEYGSWEPKDVPLAAHDERGEMILNGEAFFVQDAFKADFLLATATMDDWIVLCMVEPDAPGLTLEQNHIHDLTRDQATVHFDSVRVGLDGIICLNTLPALERAWPRLLVLLAADMCGASEWLLQTTCDYAGQRVQFDRPIGYFQAVKHPLVNVMTQIDLARSLLYSACAELDAGVEKGAVSARMAKAAASDAAAFASDRAVQLHGGIGFTWEYALHIYFKRNLHNQALLGDSTYQCSKLADVLIGPIGVERVVNCDNVK